MGTVTVAIDLSNVPGAKAQADLRLLVDADGVFNAGATALTGTLAGNIFTVTNVALANGNYFTIGSISLTTPLPVQITQFDLIGKNGSVDIRWSTASELNADYFDVMRSQKGIEFEFVGRVKAAGTTSLAQHYSLDDPLPFDGTSYYKLVQVDRDHQIKYSQVKSVTLDLTEPSVNTFPNPVVNGSVSIDFKNWSAAPATLFIYDSSGNLQTSVGLNAVNGSTTTLQLPESISSGLYLFRIVGQNKVFSTKIFVAR